MKMKTILLLGGLLAQIVYGQSENLQIQVKPVAENDVSWETTLTITLPAAMLNGFLLELPAGVQMIPISVTENTRPLWLQNSSQPAVIDSVVSWQTTTQGPVFMFRDGQAGSRDQLQIVTMTTLSGKRPGPQALISLRPYTPGQPPGEAAASVALPPEWTQPGQ